jgi:hypothetical protein
MAEGKQKRHLTIQALLYHVAAALARWFCCIALADGWERSFFALPGRAGEFELPHSSRRFRELRDALLDGGSSPSALLRCAEFIRNQI